MLCALPLRDVIETLRPLPIEPLAGAPSYVCGLSILRGAPVPVVDLGLLLGVEQLRATRLVALRVGARTVAAAVSEVLGVRTLAGNGALPPLLKEAGHGAIQTLGSLDRELLLVLEGARIVPEEVFAQLPPGARQA
jgi:purine-binding chemotaxis protein CheW